MATAVQASVDINSVVWSGVKALGGMVLNIGSRSTSSDGGGSDFGFSKRVSIGKRLSDIIGGGISSIEQSSQTLAAGT